MRRALAGAGFPADADPGLRPAGVPGRYAASVALALGANPRETARTLARALAQEDWVSTAEVTGPGYLTVTVTPGALAAVADNVTRAGPACVTSDALAGMTVPAAPPGDPLAAATWEEARAALAARLTARLAAAAGATVTGSDAAERVRLTPPAPAPAGHGGPSPREAAAGGYGGPSPREAIAGGCGGLSPRAAAAFAGRDAVTFTLARAIPGRLLRVDPRIIARHVPGNPAYAVRYAHARAASGVRWVAASSAADTIGVAEAPELSIGGCGGPPPREVTAPGELALLDALSWLPERVATAARRGRPDEFARYLEDLASVTVDVLSSASHPGSAPGTSRAPGSDRLTLAVASRTGLAAGLGLLEVSAPERL